MSKKDKEIKEKEERASDASEDIIKTSKSETSEKEVVNWEDKYFRALAEHQNLLKQTAKDKEDFRQFAQVRFIDQILPVYDNLKISLVHVGEEKSSWVQGVEYVIKQFGDTLKQMGVEEIEAVGKEYDHEEMEAVSEEETDDQTKNHQVAKQITCGYKLNGRVIRAARVVVYKLKTN